MKFDKERKPSMNSLNWRKLIPYGIGVILFSVLYYSGNHIRTVHEALQFQHLKFILIFIVVQIAVFLIRGFIMKRKND